MTGFARPELLATPEWLANEMNRETVRVIDVRWRPDGSAAQVFESGHVPGAVHLDWRSELTEPPAEEEGPALRLASSERAAAAFVRAGISDGSTVVLYDDTVSLFAAWTWWALRVHGFESVRVLDGGFPAWQAARRPVSTASVSPSASGQHLATTAATRHSPQAQSAPSITASTICVR